MVFLQMQIKTGEKIGFILKPIFENWFHFETHHRQSYVDYLYSLPMIYVDHLYQNSDIAKKHPKMKIGFKMKRITFQNETHHLPDTFQNETHHGTIRFKMKRITERIFDYKQLFILPDPHQNTICVPWKLENYAPHSYGRYLSFKRYILLVPKTKFLYFGFSKVICFRSYAEFPFVGVIICLFKRTKTPHELP